MGRAKKEPISIEELARNLATYAIDREEIKELIRSIPGKNDLNLATVEYELQIMRILSIGWAISFYMPEKSGKKSLSLLFWEHIREISTSISNLMENTTGRSIDYFMILKERLDIYLSAMQKNPDNASQPTVIMGPAFASACCVPGNPMAILIGTKMFTLCLGSVKAYMDSVKIETVLC